METFYQNFLRAFCKTIQGLLIIMALNACERDRDATSPLSHNSGGRSGPITNVPDCPTGQHWDHDLQQCVSDDESIDCSLYTDVQGRERNRAVSIYGQNGGYNFDQVLSSSADNYSDIAGYSQSIYSYATQLESALLQAGSDYAATFSGCDNCSATYDSNSFLTYINNRINPLKNTITNDGSLSGNERNILLYAIQAVYDNFDEIGSIIENHTDCYPNPAWYGSSRDNGSITNGFFSNIQKNIRKNINILSTILKYVGFNAVRGAIYGIGGGNAGIILGATTGAIAGIVIGIRMVNQGQYACIFYPCP